jgi:transposase
MRAYSTDLRTKILDQVEAGMSKSEAARVFGVSLATVKRYAALRRAHGSLAPQPHPGRPPTIGTAQQEVLRAQLQAYPDAYLDEHCALFAAQTDLVVSTSTMSRAIRKLRWTRKKGRWVPASATRPTAGSGTGSSGI